MTMRSRTGRAESTMGGSDGFGVQPVLLEQDDDIAFLFLS